MFAERLQLLLDEHDESQAGLARKVPAISQPSISEWVRGESEPKAAAIVAVADHFGVSVDWLLGLSPIRARLVPGHHLMSARVFCRTRRLRWGTTLSFAIPEDAIVVPPDLAQRGPPLPNGAPVSAEGSP